MALKFSVALHKASMLVRGGKTAAEAKATVLTEYKLSDAQLKDFDHRLAAEVVASKHKRNEHA